MVPVQYVNAVRQPYRYEKHRHERGHGIQRNICKGHDAQHPDHARDDHGQRQKHAAPRAQRKVKHYHRHQHHEREGAAHVLGGVSSNSTFDHGPAGDEDHVVAHVAFLFDHLPYAVVHLDLVLPLFKLCKYRGCGAVGRDDVVYEHIVVEDRRAKLLGGLRRFGRGFHEAYDIEAPVGADYVVQRLQADNVFADYAVHFFYLEAKPLHEPERVRVEHAGRSLVDHAHDYHLLRVEDFLHLLVVDEDGVFFGHHGFDVGFHAERANRDGYQKGCSNYD